MNAHAETALVTFHGQQLLTIKDEGAIRVAMKPICEALGINWDGQRQRIQRHPVLSEGAVIITVPSEGGQQDTLTLPLDYLNGWLFGIDSRRIKSELKESLRAYQRECFAVLAAYWQQGVATNPRAPALTIQQLLSTQREARALMQELKKETAPIIRQALHAQLAQLCRLMDLPTPPLDAIGHDAPPESPLIAQFWKTVAYITSAGTLRNHARDARLWAINLPEYERAARKHDMHSPPLAEIRHVLKQSREPQFVGYRAVNSAILHRAIKCYVFEIETR